MRIVVGNDHSALESKEYIINLLRNLGHLVIDVGTSSAQRTHSVLYAQKAAKLVCSGQADRAILICGTGVGMSIAANKIKGIRAVLCADEYTAKQSREHNDTNVLALGAKTLGKTQIDTIIEIWLETDFLDEDIRRYRLSLIEQLENVN